MHVNNILDGYRLVRVIPPLNRYKHLRFMTAYCMYNRITNAELEGNFMRFTWCTLHMELGASLINPPVNAACRSTY